MLTQKEAISRVLKVNISAKRAVDRLTHWDEKLTIVDNARKLNISQTMAMQLVYRHCLDFKHRKASWRLKHTKTYAYLELKKAGWTLSDIAKAFKVTHQSVSCCLKTRANDPIKDNRGRRLNHAKRS